jgi:hypothetical protein
MYDQMLFHIDDSVCDSVLSTSASELDIQSLEYLLLGAAEGNHKIVGSRSALRRLAMANGLSLRATKTLERALARVAQEGNLFHRLKTVGEIRATASHIPYVSVSGDRRIITFPLRWFDRSGKIQPVTILGENLSDVRICKIIGEVGVVLEGFGYLPFSHVPAHGGGSTVGVVLEEIASRDQICICVVDSDRVFPNGNVGATASSVARFKNSNYYPLITVMETAGRDLENMLPDVFYRSRYRNHPTYQALITLLEELSQNDQFEIRYHLDIEKGLVLYDILNFTPASPERIFWESKVSVIASFIGNPVEGLPCHGLVNCPQNSRHACACPIVNGLPTNVLDDFFDFSQGKNRFVRKSEVDNGVLEEWLRLGAELGSWCCGDDRLRI